MIIPSNALLVVNNILQHGLDVTHLHLHLHLLHGYTDHACQYDRHKVSDLQICMSEII